MSLLDHEVRAPLDLFHRTYHSLLRSSGEIGIQALADSYAAMAPSLHEGLHHDAPDLAALTYTSLRLPACIDRVRLVLLGQAHEVFARHGYPDVESWQPVSAPGRRRKMFYDGHETLAVLIASPSDVDDLVPMLVSFQIEWNKLWQRLNQPAARGTLARLREGVTLGAADFAPLGLGAEDALRLQTVWSVGLHERLRAMGEWKKRFAVRMLGGSLMDYERATLRWWWHIERCVADIDLRTRRVYFVSSNTHSLINLFSGFALHHSDELLEYVRRRQRDLLGEYDRIIEAQVPSSIENYFYYIQKKYQQSGEGADYFARRDQAERRLGMVRVPSRFYIDVAAQVIDVSRLDPAQLDPRLRPDGAELLRASRAVIVNIDYPLGLAAYHILKIVARSVGALAGVYVIGKAATLNGRIGDVLIPNEVFDEHTGNTFHFVSAFSAADVEPFLAHGSVLDNQKAITSRGTFLQNQAFLEVCRREFLTDLEMESGPYLNALYEQAFAQRHPTGEVVSLLRPPCDLGFLHYASDTPASKGHNLGTRNLSYFGMDPTYATSVAVARRILHQELETLQHEARGG